VLLASESDMERTDLSYMKSPAKLAQELRSLRLTRSFVIALAFSLLFLVLTAYQSAATLFSRIDQTDVMKAASGAAISGRIGFEMAWFVLAQIALHLVLATIVWVLAIASAVTWPVVREKIGRIVVGWFSLLAGATIAYNAYWYPRTLMGAYYHDIVSAAVGPWPLAKFIYIGVVAFAIFALASAVWTVSRHLMIAKPGRAFAGALAAIAAGVATVIWADVNPMLPRTDTARRPNVIVLGIDSLRLDQLQRFGGSGSTPNIDQFLAGADVLRDTSTPAARTFSSWTAILTGRGPTVTGARFNLAARRTVAANPTIGDVLRRDGYKTVYSTDEVRFANIDESFGFDQVITPSIGASDFLIGTYNELPLASVVVNTRLGQWLFPFSYANRGVATMFQPETYLARVERELSFDKPTLFIAHLTAAHWPYYVSDTPFGISEPGPSGEHPLYHIGLQTADRMFGELIEMLQRKGALDNALVVILSDHGEAFGLPTDTVIADSNAAFIEGLRAPIKINDHGHGQSVLSPSQYKVLLGFRSFGDSDLFRSTGRDLDVPVTVEDIAPTILDLLNVPGNPLGATGQSLASTLSSDSAALPQDVTDRIRFTETDLAVLPGPGGGVDEAATARQNSMFFNVDPHSGRLEIRERFEPLATAFKERAAFTKRYVLAALPAGPYAHQYVLFDTVSGNGRLLLEAPGLDQPEVQRLWDGLHAHYRGELKPAVAVTREDWPRIDQEWREFLVRRETRTATARSISVADLPSAEPYKD
jgi:hypothetical protein